MTDRFVTVPDSLELPAAVKVGVDRLHDSTVAGRALLTGADAAAQRSSLGLGTAATASVGDFATAAQGALATTGASAILRASRAASPPRPLISLIDDDGHEKVVTVLAPELIARGIPAGVAVIGNTSGVLTNPTHRAALKELQDDHGWEVLSHTMAHLRIPDTDEATYIADTEAHQALMASYGLDVQGIVYPYGGEGANWHIAPRYYHAGYNTSAAVNTRYKVDNYAVRRIGIGAMMAAPYQTLGDFQALIDSVKANGQWLVLMTHIAATDGAGLQLIRDTLDYAIAQGVAFARPRDGLREFGGLIQSGRKGASTTSGYLTIHPDGVIESSRYRLMEWDDGGKLETDPPGTLGSGRTVTYLIKAASSWSIGYGWVVERLESAGWQTQEFQTYVGKRYIRRWNGSWSGWKEFLYGTLLTVTMPAQTIAAHSTSNKSHFSTLALAADTWTACPTGSLEAGIIFNVWSHGNGAVNIRLANITAAPIDVAERVWTLRAITT